LGHLVESSSCYDYFELAALFDVLGVIEHEVIEHHLVDGERDVALGLPLDRLIERLDGHAGYVEVPGYRLSVADSRDSETPMDPGVVEQRLDLFRESLGVSHLVVLDQAWWHRPHG